MLVKYITTIVMVNNTSVLSTHSVSDYGDRYFSVLDALGVPILPTIVGCG